MQSKNNLVAEYALKDMTKPMGVSEYKLTGQLPEELENSFRLLRIFRIE